MPATSLVASDTPISTSTSTPSPTATFEPTIHQPELISQRKLACSALGAFTKCIDDVLGMEFEYPTDWGESEPCYEPEVIQAMLTIITMVEKQ